MEHGYASGTNTIAAAATNISEIRMLVNTRVQRTISGTQLRDPLLLNGTAYDCVSGTVPNTAPGVPFFIPFAEPWRADAADRDALAWPTIDWDTFRLRCVFGAQSSWESTQRSTSDALTRSMPVLARPAAKHLRLILSVFR